MRTHDGELKKFKKNPRYTHHRSEGLTWRRNKGSIYQRRESTMQNNWEQLRNDFEQGLKDILNGVIVDAKDLQTFDGPLRQAANNLLVAVRRGDQALVQEAKDALTLALMEQEAKLKQTANGVLDLVINVAFSALFKGAMAGMRADNSSTRK